jgi:hypothetical protein
MLTKNCIKQVNKKIKYLVTEGISVSYKYVLSEEWESFEFAKFVDG